VTKHEAKGVLLTGVYGSGKSSVAEEIAYLLEQRGESYALLDLDYLSWERPSGPSRRAGRDDIPRMALDRRRIALEAG
jgi:adenylylsulfate kinase-like enzyme